MQRTKENLNNKCHCSKCNLQLAVGMMWYSQHVSLSFFYSLECFLSAYHYTACSISAHVFKMETDF